MKALAHIFSVLALVWSVLVGKPPEHTDFGGER